MSGALAPPLSGWRPDRVGPAEAEIGEATLLVLLRRRILWLLQRPEHDAVALVLPRDDLVEAIVHKGSDIDLPLERTRCGQTVGNFLESFDDLAVDRIEGALAKSILDPFTL